MIRLREMVELTRSHLGKTGMDQPGLEEIIRHLNIGQYAVMRNIANTERELMIKKKTVPAMTARSPPAGSPPANSPTVSSPTDPLGGPPCGTTLFWSSEQVRRRDRPPG